MIKLVVLEIGQNLDLTEHASVDYTKNTESLGKKTNSFYSDIVTTYVGGYPLISCIQRAGSNALAMYILKGHYMSEVKTYNGYFKGNVFRACLIRCRQSLSRSNLTSLGELDALDRTDLSSFKPGGKGKWDCKIWTVDEGG